MAARVIAYTTAWCGYCRSAKSLLRARGIPFDEIDVDGDSSKRQWLREVTGSRTVPQIFIDGASIGGSDELHDLDRSGELARLLATPAPPERS